MIQAAVRHGTQLAVAVLILCVLGVVAVFRVPVQMIPDLDERIISVETNWPGATPQDVEKEILIEQEDYLRSIPNLRRITSTAATGSAQIEMEFPFGVDINETLLEVNNALSQVPAYPENVDEPRISSNSFSDNAFMFFDVAPLPGSGLDLDMGLVRDFVDDNVRTRMERVPGVSQVNINGGAERQVQIKVDPAKLAARGVTLADLRDTIRARNRDVSAGDVDSGKRRYLLRTIGRFSTLDELENLIVDQRGDSIVRLKDVATVTLDHYELRGVSLSRGHAGIGLFVMREPGSNVIEIKKAMMPVVDELNRDVLEPRGLELSLRNDDVHYVEESVANVWTNLVLGAALATAVMFLFFRSLAPTLVGGIGIPVCTIAAFMGLLFFGRTINVISLAGVAFAIGMTLDNSIVVLENIETLRRKGLSRREAAIKGAQQVWPAVLASTLTTILVFAPVIFIRQEAGQLFSDIAIAISGAILTSMLVAVTVIPSITSRLPMGNAGEAAARGLKARLLAAVSWIVASARRRLAVLGGILAVTAGIIIVLTPPAEYLPEGEEAKTFAQMIAPPGYNLTEMEAIARDIMPDFEGHLFADRGPFERGETDIPPLRQFTMNVNPTRIMIIAETLDPHDIDYLMGKITERYRTYPGMRAFAARGSIISSNDGGTRSINLDIAGTDLGEIYRTADEAYRRAETLFQDPQISSSPSSLTLAQPLIEIRPRWTRVAELGFSAQEFGFAAAALSDGAFVDEFLMEGDKIDIFLFGPNGPARTLDTLAHLPLYTPSGRIVPLGAAADLVETVDTDTLRRVDGRRTVTLNIIPPRSVPLETGVQMVQQDLVGKMRRDGAIPEGVSITLSGASDELTETRQALAGNFAVALILSYLLLVAIFGHWGYPFLIMTTVPLGIAGGIVGLWLLNAVGGLLPFVGLGAIRQPFDMITMLGFLILLGTVVNNPILIVHEAVRSMKEEGLAYTRAVKDAVASRLRPMLMSTITTVVGLSPLVFMPGAGTELYRGVGAIVLFGLLFSTAVTLLFLPPLIVTAFKLRDWAAERLAAARPELSKGSRTPAGE